MNIYEKKFFAALDKVISEADTPDATISRDDVSGAPVVTDTPPEDMDEVAASDKVARDAELDPESVEQLDGEDATRRAMAETNTDTDNVLAYLSKFSDELNGYVKEYNDKAEQIRLKLQDVISQKCTGQFSDVADKCKLSGLLTTLVNSTNAITKSMGDAALQLSVVASENAYTARQNEKK